MHEKKAFYISGYLMLAVKIIGVLIGIALIGLGAMDRTNLTLIVIGAIVFLLAWIVTGRLVTINPNESAIVTFMGKYIGTIKQNGFFMTYPLVSTEKVSLRIQNFNSPTIKVNDAVGNPVDIAAVIVYQVQDTAKVRFNVDNYERFIRLQSESAIRHIAGEYPYDNFDNHHTKTLRGNASDVSAALTRELQSRLDKAGLKILETRITHLAYSTEIASAMLQRQQASAVLSARKIIVRGAVSIAENAIDKLEKDNSVQLSEQQKARMINNVLVSIINERGTQNVMNTGSDNS
ncbi:membrane protein [Philodulcilactobacillus myokoensis]|uniref:Membrane protein n=1 Tax=Philodulcilactobacillus myokoensis TaxID=2929573 RepID=A0A9W6B2V5_9LACO|nr:SPFH domain-containing protein [Philodulcilactobacillus myokoensis]GLB47338.1 membrane protein [Philodulcilactobacillus myokoensis]